MRSSLRQILSIVLSLAAGCGPSAPVAVTPAVPQQVSRDVAPVEPAATASQPRETFVSAAKTSEPPPSLWTRKAGSDWPIFLGPTQDSHSPEKGLLTRWAGGVPRIVWHKQLGTSYGAPSVAGGRLFQLDRFGKQSRLYCLKAETGSELWRYEFPTQYEDLYQYNNGPRCSPIVDSDRVYAYGVDGMLVCCRAEDGKPVWKKNVNQEFGVVQNFFGIGSTPVIEGDLLICMVGGSTPESQRVAPGQLDRVIGNGSGLVAFDKFTGEVKYKISDELASYASLKLATIGERRWCLAFCRGGLVGFEPASGKVDFHYPWRAPILESVNASMPVVVGDEVLISETYGPGSSLLQVSTGKADVLWRDDRRRDKAMQTHWNTPVYVDGYLYGSSGRHESAELRCIEWKTGKVLWNQPGMGRSSLLYVDGHFLCLGEFGQLWLLKVNPEKFEQVAAIDFADPAESQKLVGDGQPVLTPPCWAAPIIAHGLVYLRGKDRLICLEMIPE